MILRTDFKMLGKDNTEKKCGDKITGNMLESFSQKENWKVTGIHPEYSWLKECFTLSNPDSKAQDTIVGETWTVSELCNYRLGLAPALRWSL